MEDKNLKIKILALVIFSNLCSFLLGSSDSPDIANKKIKPHTLIRPNYVSIRIKANVLTELDSLNPLLLSNSEKTHFIPNIFIQKQIFQQNGFNLNESNSQESEVIISIHKKYLKQFFQMKSFVILPNIQKEYLNAKQSKQKRKSYEISI